MANEDCLDWNIEMYTTQIYCICSDDIAIIPKRNKYYEASYLDNSLQPLGQVQLQPRWGKYVMYSTCISAINHSSGIGAQTVRVH